MHPIWIIHSPFTDKSQIPIQASRSWISRPYVPEFDIQIDKRNG